MFKPQRVIIEEKALDYEGGKLLLEKFERENIDVKMIKGGRVSGIPGKTDQEMFFYGKNTLVVGVRKESDFQTCKPSAHYMLPIVSGCVGMCEYCYLNTQLGKRPYSKVYVNVEEILERADKYIEERKPHITIFEGAATSDPLPVERYGHGLSLAIKHFGRSELGYFRFVTKFDEVDPLLGLEHNGHTTIRFTLNTDRVIKEYEHKVPVATERIEASFKVSESGYPIGFIIAPVFLYDGWRSDYSNLITILGEKLRDSQPTFEVITHRFTKRAKDQILNTFPQTELPMNEEVRKFKYGQFGYGKYVYKDEDIDEVKIFFKENLGKYFKQENIRYII
ncbi:MAG: spore photoproduct lyase, splB [Clostridiales bacterium]|nr:spore photoproduct lyase, splB [Clostridiales bacterium]